MIKNHATQECIKCGEPVFIHIGHVHYSEQNPEITVKAGWCEKHFKEMPTRPNGINHRPEPVMDRVVESTFCNRVSRANDCYGILDENLRQWEK